MKWLLLFFCELAEDGGWGGLLPDAAGMVLDMLALDMPLNKSPSKSSVSLNKTI
jgi:hypothetical protein